MTLRARIVLLTAAIVATFALVATPALAGAPPPLQIGFSDGIFTSQAGPVWLGRAAAAGADVVRIDIGWVAPDTQRRPRGFNAENPASPFYDFKESDAAVEAATSHNLRVILTFTGAPPWAEGPHPPKQAAPGSWEPRPRAIREYAIALARRYSGRFPDPGDPLRTLPRVWAFQLWNEPNLSLYLAPQWQGNRPESPLLYRAMLNAFYSGIKSVDRGALVVTAGTAPFGDAGPGGQRIMPAFFWRVVLCQQQSRGLLASTHCSDPPHFDVLAHHPYSVGEPSTKALNPDDVSIPDMWKLARILRAAERDGDALPRIHHPLWVTETGYNTRPPNPQGVPVAEDARWLDQTLELLWSQGVSLVDWYLIVDQPPGQSYFDSSQSGVYYADGSPKPALAAFRFPVYAWRAGDEVEVWGRSPAQGELSIDTASAGGRWHAVDALSLAAHATFITHFIDTSEVTVRAATAGETSLAWPIKASAGPSGARTPLRQPGRRRHGHKKVTGYVAVRTQVSGGRLLTISGRRKAAGERSENLTQSARFQREGAGDMTQSKRTYSKPTLIRLGLLRRLTRYTF